MILIDFLPFSMPELSISKGSLMELDINSQDTIFSLSLNQKD